MTIKLKNCYNYLRHAKVLRSSLKLSANSFIVDEEDWRGGEAHINL